MPIAFSDDNTNLKEEGTFTTPTVPSSSLPALLGLKTLMDHRAILDITNMQLHFVGPGPGPRPARVGGPGHQGRRRPVAVRRAAAGPATPLMARGLVPRSRPPGRQHL